MRRWLKKLVRLPKFIKCYLSKDESVLLTLIEEEANNLLEQYGRMGTCNIEGIEDLLFHIKSYSEIPEVVKQIEFPNMKEINLFYEDGSIRVFELGSRKPSIEDLEVYIKYIEEVEKQRAVERDFIFEKVKELPLGFSAC